MLPALSRNIGGFETFDSGWWSTFGSKPQRQGVPRLSPGAWIAFWCILFIISYFISFWKAGASSAYMCMLNIERLLNEITWNLQKSLLHVWSCMHVCILLFGSHILILVCFQKATGKPLQIDAFPVAGSLIHLARRWSPAPSATWKMMMSVKGAGSWWISAQRLKGGLQDNSMLLLQINVHECAKIAKVALIQVDDPPTWTYPFLKSINRWRNFHFWDFQTLVLAIWKFRTFKDH